ncbi:MAG: hypothetical protein ABI969_04350 [bacterium]
MRRLLLLIGLVACGSKAPLVSTAPAPQILPMAPTGPASFVRSTSEALVTRTIDVREGITRAVAMRLLTDALAVRYTVDVTDPRAGFAMTAWQASLHRDGVPDLRYRTRLTARFQGDDWRTLQLRDEANWQRGDEWDVGYDPAQLDSVANDLRARLGKRS